MIKYSILFLTLPQIAYAGSVGKFLSTCFATAIVSVSMYLAYILLMAFCLFFQKIFRRDALLKIKEESISFKISLCCYILFFSSCCIVVENDVMTIFIVGYLFLGVLIYGAYTNYRETFFDCINYLFTFYEFIVLLVVSNDDFMHDFIDYDYNDNHMFVFLLFSFPTIAYVSSIIFEKGKTDRHK